MALPLRVVSAWAKRQALGPRRLPTGPGGDRGGAGGRGPRLPSQLPPSGPNPTDGAGRRGGPCASGPAPRPPCPAPDDCRVSCCPPAWRRWARTDGQEKPQRIQGLRRRRAGSGRRSPSLLADTVTGGHLRPAPEPRDPAAQGQDLAGPPRRHPARG